MKNNMKKDKKTKTQKPFSIDQEFIYSDGKNFMEKVRVIECLETMATLSNRVKVKFSNGEYLRVDNRPGKLEPYTETNKSKFDAYMAYFAILRKCEYIQRNIRIENLELSEEQQQKVIIKLSKHINKLCTLLNI